MTLLLFSGLILAAFLQYLELSLVEVIQQRIFARVALKLANRIPLIQSSAIYGKYAPELMNRFFDVLTVQKTWSKLLLTGITAVLQIFFGLVLISFYSPILLAFDFFIVLAIVFVVFVLGKGGLKTSLVESKHKYKVAHWLEEMALCQNSFKINGEPSYFFEKADDFISDYIVGRKEHFKVLARQSVANYILFALATTGIFAIGGWLVINRQLTLGQLVASELIIVSILGAFQKLVQDFDRYYDLFTGMEKVSQITELPLERIGGQKLVSDDCGLNIQCNKVHFAYENNLKVLSGINLKIDSGGRESLVGMSGAGKSTLAMLLCGFYDLSSGSIELNNMDIRDLDLVDLRSQVSFVEDSPDIFEGTIEENITLGRKNVSSSHLQWAIDSAHLSDDIDDLPEGTKTLLVSAGKNISRGLMQRILIARGIVSRPKLLVLDEAFTGIDEKTKMLLIDEIYSRKYKWTIVSISHDAELVIRSEKVHVLHNGKIVESGAPKDLILKPQSDLALLFPDLARQQAGAK